MRLKGEIEMQGSKNYRRVIMLAMVMAFLLFMSLAFGILPPGGKAIAASPSGWIDQTPFPNGENLNDISAIDINTAWAVGANGTILKTLNGGQTWSQQASNQGQTLTHLSAVDSQVAWAAGSPPDAIETFGSYAVVLSTSDGGNNWAAHDAVKTQFRDVPYFGPYISSMEVAGLAAADASTAWVTINYYLLIPNPFYPPSYLSSFEICAIWKTLDGGSNWTMQYSTNWWASLGKIYATDANTVWAAGRITNFSMDGLLANILLKSTDGGTTWQSQNPGPNAQSFFSVADSQNAWTISNGAILKTSDGGTSWTSVALHLPFEPFAPAVLSVVDANVAWIQGYDPGNPTLSMIAKTIDGGQTWTPQFSATTAYLHGLSSVNPTVAWAVGDGGTIFKTTDGGDARPDVLSVSPASATWGDQVSITGVDFGATQGSSTVAGVTDYVSWSDTQIVVKVPAGTSGVVPVVVKTAAGTSNPGSLTVIPAMSVTSITPNWADTGTEVEVTIAGTGFASDAVVSLKSGETVINPASTSFVSATQLISRFTLKDAAVGTYDVIVSNPGGFSATLAGGFSVTAPSPCGFGSGMGMLVLGLSLGLLSLAGSLRMSRGKK
jgi:photosystem II stability/assembly factor-like uncharacterized protein